MGTDYAEKERTFIAELEADTGRGLSAWLAAISETGLTSRNDIIDWLRQSGFTFSNASWIERIHHNGGRLVYADGGERPPTLPLGVGYGAPREMPPPIPPVLASRSKAGRSLEAVRHLAIQPTLQPATGPSSAEPASPLVPLQPLPEIQPPAAAEFSLAALSGVLVLAKGLRPLAELVLREISVAVPSARFDAADPFVNVSASGPFASLLLGSKRLLLYSDFGGTGSNGVKTGAAVAKGPPPYPHMLVLDDARRIDQQVRDTVAAAAARRNQ